MRILATVDIETDPFQHGREIRPFSWGFYDGDDYHSVWRDSLGCMRSFIDFLETLDEPHIIYAHNGGRFDFLFMLPWLDPNKLTIINGRIVECQIGRHVLRDSYAILPVPLRDAGDKGEIDYKKMEAARRHRHRAEIMAYLERDVRELYSAVLAFRARFGHKLTMAGAAIAALRVSVEAEHSRPHTEILERFTQQQDIRFRQFYFGGRVDCFERGVIDDNLRCIDATSMYPSVMQSAEHPVGRTYLQQTEIDDRTDFAIVDATSRGAFPLRADNGSLSFPHAREIYRVTGHELRAAMALGLIDLHDVVWAARCTMRSSFKRFVDDHFRLRQDCVARGDDRGKLHYKLVLNSSYGRFALDPERLFEWRISGREDRVTLEFRSEGWEPALEGPEVVMWRRPAPESDKRRAIMNVATGASITGAARAKLMGCIASADRPIYCDTDSLVCRSANVELGTGLGQWHHEVSADRAAVAGKKLYALFQDGKSVKHASKGCRITPEEIVRVARGEIIQWRAEAPTFNIAGGYTYMTRNIRMTGAIA